MLTSHSLGSNSSVHPKGTRSGEIHLPYLLPKKEMTLSYLIPAEGSDQRHFPLRKATAELHGQLRLCCWLLRTPARDTVYQNELGIDHVP